MLGWNMLAHYEGVNLCIFPDFQGNFGALDDSVLTGFVRKLLFL